MSTRESISHRSVARDGNGKRPSNGPAAGPGAIEISDLEKRFGATEAVRGISLRVEPGEIFGLLGPNGAGKTTTIKILLALYRPTAGHASVAGFDVATQTDQVRQVIGWVPQEPALDPLLTGRENLIMQAGMYHLPARATTERVDELLELVELNDAADRIVRTYSGGMKKRLDLAMGLVHRPQVLFLDEPTLGLDIQARRRLWNYIRTFRDLGTTLLLTTHYLDEADALCDRIAIIDHGVIKALDSPDRLKADYGRESIRILLGPTPDYRASEIEQSLAGRSDILSIERITTGFRLEVSSHAAAVPILLEEVQQQGIALESIVCERPSLDDVFLQLTGYSLRERVQAGGTRKR